jgi:CO/xanthine dehydrogenase Mo-binding subunit/CO/xanthine dehydrogenase FAD-binding subunit
VNVGRSVRSIDWDDRTAGRVRYTADLDRPEHLFGAILRSPHPYARILAIDALRASRMPGVRAVVTTSDFRAGVRYIHRGGTQSDRPPLADGVVRYIGQEVAAVAADTQEQADAACRAIRVRYRVEPAPLTPTQSFGHRRALHERVSGERNVSVRWSSAWGDVDAGRSAAAVSVSGRFVYPSVAHACMEPNSTLAAWDVVTQRVELWTSTQAPWFIAEEVSHLLGIPHDDVVCREVAVGGGFGSKSKASEHEIVAAALSRKAQRPVLVALSRADEFAANKPRHRFETTLTTYADRTGRITLYDADILVDNGAYNHMGTSVMRVGVITLGSVYRPDGVRFDARLVDTATQPGGQFRGYGTPQVSLAAESQVDEIADKLGMDPIDLRLHNLAQPHTTSLCGYRITTSRLADCLLAVRDELGWEQRESRRTPGRGWGVAVGVHGSGAYAYEQATRSDAAIDVFDDGRVRVRFGGADAGTGQCTILGQIAADELGVDLAAVSVQSMDSDETPFDLGAWSSRGTHMTGMSVGKAAREMAERLRALGAQKLGRDDVTLRAGSVVAGDEAVPIGDLVRLSVDAVDGVLSHETTYLLDGTEPITPGIDTANLSPTYAFAAHGAQVDVDRRTGKVTVSDYVAAHDVGRAINPMMVCSQIVGGAVMGLGAALGEELIREGGRVVNPAYVNYALPRANDLPSVRPVVVESYDSAGPYGAKSVGEMSIIPPGAAVANAVYDAVGVRIRELPITPDKVLTALARAEGRRRRYKLWRRPSTWWVSAIRSLYPLGLHWVLHRVGARLGRRVGPGPAVPTTPDLYRPATIADASARAASGAVLLGGATDVITETRLRPRPPIEFVAVAAIAGLRDITELDDGSLSIGAAVTLAELSETLSRLGQLSAVTRAIESIASPQIRNAATVAGNLVQAKRCWFFRNGFACYKRSGPANPCYAVLGDHRFQHAAIGGHRCQAVTPSDLGTVLHAYDAEVIVATGDKRRTVPIGQFYTGPGETVLRNLDVVVAVVIPASARARMAAFEKLALTGGDFAIVSATVSALPDGKGAWSDTRVVLGAMAPTPLRMPRVERSLRADMTVQDVRELVDRELDRIAHPLPRNEWKLDARNRVTLRPHTGIGPLPGAPVVRVRARFARWSAMYLRPFSCPLLSAAPVRVKVPYNIRLVRSADVYQGPAHPEQLSAGDLLRSRLRGRPNRRGRPGIDRLRALPEVRHARHLDLEAGLRRRLRRRLLDRRVRHLGMAVRDGLPRAERVPDRRGHLVDRRDRAHALRPGPRPEDDSRCRCLPGVRRLLPGVRVLLRRAAAQRRRQ